MDGHCYIILITFLVIYTRYLVAQDSLYLAVTQEECNSSCYQGTVYNSTGRPCECFVIERNQSIFTASLSNNTCAASENVLDFCSKLYTEHSVYSIDIKWTNSTTNHTYTCESLYNKMEQIRGHLRAFELLLARTLVCVYLQTCEDKTQCLRAYTNWLCTTQLKLHNATQANIIKPCYDICKNVLMKCPYYLPSSVQQRNTTNNTTRSMDRNYVYGGYPAFACPKPADNPESSTYSENKNCLNLTVV